MIKKKEGIKVYTLRDARQWCKVCLTFFYPQGYGFSEQKVFYKETEREKWRE